MRLSVEIFILLLLILVNGVFSMGEIALVSARRAGLEVLERRGVPGAALARELADDPQRFLPTVQVGITTVSIVAGVFGGAQFSAPLARALELVPALRPVADSLAFVLVVLLTTYLTLVLGELVPKQLGLRSPERTAVLVARPFAAFARVTGPVVWVLSGSSGLVLRLFGVGRTGRPPVTEEEVKAVLAEGAREGVLEAEEKDMIERVLRLADKPVRAIMTPRTELAWIDRTDPKADIVATLRAAPHSRLVVCDRAVDYPVGVVLAKDMLNRLLDGGDLSLAAALRRPMVLPDTATALDALERLRRDPLGLALVMDEYGSFEGVVTAADVLQAIVGSERDDAVAAATAAPGGDGAEAITGPLVLDGAGPVDEVKARLHLPDLPSEGNYHTLAGLVLALLRRVPRPGDKIVFGGWRFEVLAMDGRRVTRVGVEREPLTEEA